MLGVHAREARLACEFFCLQDYRPGSVITAVIRLRQLIRFNIKHLLAGTALVALGLFVLAPLRVFLPGFYYEEYNLVQRRLEAVTGLTITKSWRHEDITLEDCGFDVDVDGTSVYLTFIDHQNWLGLFDDVDGIRFHENGGHVYISREQIRNAGIEIDGLADILGRLADVVEVCRNGTNLEPDKSFENYRNYIKMGVRN